MGISTFFDWGASELQTIVAELLDGELEYVLDEQFAEARALLPRDALQNRMRSLHRRRDQCLEADLQPPQPHRPVRRGTANVAERTDSRHHLPTSFHSQPDWHSDFRKIRWQDQPNVSSLPVLFDAQGHSLPLLNVSLLSLFFPCLWPFFLLVENIVFVFFAGLWHSIWRLFAKVRSEGQGGPKMHQLTCLKISINP